MRILLALALAVIAPAATAQVGQGKKDDGPLIQFEIQIIAEPLGGEQTRFARTNRGITSNLDFWTFVGQALTDNGIWVASRWHWWPMVGDELPITPLPDGMFGDSGANDGFVSPNDPDVRIIVGYTTSPELVQTPCLWFEDTNGSEQMLLPALANGGNAQTIGQVMVRELIIYVGGFTAGQDGVQRPAVWAGPDFELEILPAPPMGGRVTHIGPGGAYGYILTNPDQPQHIPARWTPGNGRWALTPMELSPPQGFDGARIKGGFGDQLLFGEWTDAATGATAGLLVTPIGGTDYARPFFVDENDAPASVAMSGLLRKPDSEQIYAQLGAIQKEGGSLMGWVVEQPWPQNGLMLPIPDLEGTYVERTAITGIITSDGIAVVATTGVMPGDVHRASVIVGTTGSCAADCNGDGVLNILDFVCFQGKFVAGCP